MISLCCFPRQSNIWATEECPSGADLHAPRSCGCRKPSRSRDRGSKWAVCSCAEEREPPERSAERESCLRNDEKWFYLAKFSLHTGRVALSAPLSTVNFEEAWKTTLGARHIIFWLYSYTLKFPHPLPFKKHHTLWRCLLASFHHACHHPNVTTTQWMRWGTVSKYCEVVGWSGFEELLTGRCFPSPALVSSTCKSSASTHRCTFTLRWFISSFSTSTFFQVSELSADIISAFPRSIQSRGYGGIKTCWGGRSKLIANEAVVQAGVEPPIHSRTRLRRRRDTNQLCPSHLARDPDVLKAGLGQWEGH